MLHDLKTIAGSKRPASWGGYSFAVTSDPDASDAAKLSLAGHLKKICQGLNHRGPVRIGFCLGNAKMGDRHRYGSFGGPRSLTLPHPAT